MNLLRLADTYRLGIEQYVGQLELAEALKADLSPEAHECLAAPEQESEFQAMKKNSDARTSCFAIKLSRSEGTQQENIETLSRLESIASSTKLPLAMS